MRQKLGQHFLIDESILEQILTTANIQQTDSVLEIGPGQGVLTKHLIQNAGEVIAVEFDRNLVDALQRTVGHLPNVHIVYGDARHLDYQAVLTEHLPSQQRVKVVANLPYYAATTIVLAFFQFPHVITSCTLMFQKEVAERITASPGTKSYGSLSVICQYYSAARYCFTVPPSAFQPAPKVESAVIHLEVYHRPPVFVQDEPFFLQMVKNIFLTRRKMLKNALLKNMAGKCSLAHVQEAFTHLHLPETVRAEDLSVQELAELSNVLISYQTAK
ncbi:ribosomal RNA small subunit methyltransferase A [Candidatus Moduliflexus flocculans]|uniref:Ribosomal RNA small subunit methyltransferase A n=1 Tax=Candidatus Moduliflexus flocculans TaxID=1499966 RepID=A0A0S6W3B0_9BACT|nr:ribosomal RNA small subunit methyltransferase A [Candidatus Moduliflexus flocculans]